MSSVAKLLFNLVIKSNCDNLPSDCKWVVEINFEFRHLIVSQTTNSVPRRRGS